MALTFKTALIIDHQKVFDEKIYIGKYLVITFKFVTFSGALER